MDINYTLFSAVIIAFLVVNLGVGIWSTLKARKSSVAADEQFMLGGKSVPLVVIAMSYCAAAVSAGSFIGDPALAATMGWSYFWFPIFVTSGLCIPALFIIRRLKLQADKFGVLTITDYIGARFQSNAIKLYMAVVMAICYLYMLVSQFKGAGILFQMYTGVSFETGLILMMTVVVLLVVLGGLDSVAWSSFFQGFLMVFLALVMVIGAFVAVGGVSRLDSILSVDAPEILQIVETGENAIIPWYAVPFIFLFTFFVMFSQPYLSSRYLAMGNVNRKSVGKLLIITLTITGFFNMMITAGITGRALFPEVLEGEMADYLTVTMSIELFPDIITVLIMIGFFSAIISTAAAVLLTVAQCVGNDIYGRIKKDASPKSKVIVIRVTVFVVAPLITAFNFYKTPEFLQLFVLMSLTGVGAMLCMPLFAGVIWRNATRAGAWCSAILGPVSYLVMSQVLEWSWAISMGACVIPAAIGMFVVSWILNVVKGPDEVLQKLYDVE